MVPGVPAHGSVPLRHSGNVVTRIGSQTHTQCVLASCNSRTCVNKTGHFQPDKNTEGNKFDLRTDYIK